VKDVIPLLISEDSDSDVEILGERGRVDMAWEELQWAVKEAKGKEKMKASPERPRGKRGYFGFVDCKSIDFTKNTRGWLYEPNP
jgi:hypothetical protein